MRRLLVLVAVAIAACVPAGGLAAGGGGLSVSPGSVARGDTFTLSGTGFTVPTSISFEVSGPKKADPPIHYFTAGEPLTDPCGCFSETWTAWWSAVGTYQITVWWRDSHGSTRKGGVVALNVT